MSTNYEDELTTLGDLSVTIRALIKYATEIMPVTEIKRGYLVWVGSPNYFAFRVQTRVRNVMFSVRGAPREFSDRPELPLRWGRGGSYSVFYVHRASQIPAACYYLSRAAELYRMGRGRRRRRPDGSA